MLDAAPNELAAIAFWKARGLRTMTANALGRAGIGSFEALAQTPRRKLESIYSLGKVGLLEIGTILQQQPHQGRPAASVASFCDGDLIVELIRRGYRIDRPNDDITDA